MFHFSDEHIDSYHRQGFTVFQGILPPSLVTDLRRVTDRAREIAREKYGPQAQRLQPVYAHGLDRRPFDALRDLAPLRDAITRLLSPRHVTATESMLGVLLEPAELPWCTAWHRDWRDNVGDLDMDGWLRAYRDLNLFNQVNCALYADSSTWVVPGSHLRPDLPREVERFPMRPILGPHLEGLSSVERERACLDYCRGMPGAVPLRLEAGDFALYRNTLWHLGTYVPYTKRATLHDVVDTPEFIAWRETARKKD